MARFIVLNSIYALLIVNVLTLSNLQNCHWFISDSDLLNGKYDQVPRMEVATRYVKWTGSLLKELSVELGRVKDLPRLNPYKTNKQIKLVFKFSPTQASTSYTQPESNP